MVSPLQTNYALTTESDSSSNAGRRELWGLVNPGKLDLDLRRRLLERLFRKTGVVRAAGLLGVVGVRCSDPWSDPWSPWSVHRRERGALCGETLAYSGSG